MKRIQSLAVASALTIAMAVPAFGGVNDPEVIIYRFPWTRDSGGGPGIGVATVFSCTNFSGAVETIRFVTRRGDTTLVANVTQAISHLGTIAIATHPPTNIPLNTTLNTGLVDPGTTAIAATSTDIICTATVVDGSNGAANGFALRGIRFSPVPGSQE